MRNLLKVLRVNKCSYHVTDLVMTFMTWFCLYLIKIWTNQDNGKYNSSYSFHSTIVRSICPEVFCKKSVLKNFANFTGTQLCESLFFNKIGGQRTCKRSLSDSNALPTTLVHYPNYLKPKLKNLKHHYKQAVA